MDRKMAPSSSSFLQSGTRYHHDTYSRKQKSLGLLCSNFMSLYNRDGVDLVGLDDAAKRLGVERRRIYDIVNVLESVGVLTRKAKNQYSWIGFSGIPKALDDLKAEAWREMSFAPMDASCMKENEKVLDDDEDYQNEDFGEEKLSQTSIDDPHKVRSVPDSRKEKSLGLLTQNFVKLFLTMDAETVSLDEAARLLLSDGHDLSIMRNNNAAKVRRLYDIANVLSSLNLIEKTHQAVTRKPAFRWLGTKRKQDGNAAVVIPPNTKQWNKRAFGTDITNMEYKRTMLSSSVNRKPNVVQVTSQDLKECNLTAQKQLQGSKGYVFGPFCPAGVLKGGGIAEKVEKVEKAEKDFQDWESLAASFRPKYHNQALSELFAHYMEAWNSWYVEVAQGSNTLQPPYQSVVNKLS